jgi:hypothetical protein
MTRAMFGLFLGLSVMSGARAQAADRLTRDEMIDSCVENREKGFACKEPFIDAMIELRTTRGGMKVRPEDKAKMRAKGLQEIEEDGAGPLAPRRAKCAKMIDGMRRDAGEAAKAQIAALHACHVEPDCQKAVACMMPLIAEIMFPTSQR